MKERGKEGFKKKKKKKIREDRIEEETKQLFPAPATRDIRHAAHLIEDCLSVIAGKLMATNYNKIRLRVLLRIGVMN